MTNSRPAPRPDLGGPAFAPFADRLDDFVRSGRVPPVATLEGWARARGLGLPDGRPLRFVAASARREPALDYVQRIARDGVIATREADLHDFCNALAWLAFPRTKAALNARHAAAGASPTANRRDRVRDAATLLDESGLLFACSAATIVDGLRAHRWRETFGARRADVARGVRCFALGHGLLAKLLAPFPSLTAKALHVPVDAALATIAAVDAAAAEIVSGDRLRPDALMPLPLGALPGWPGDDGRDARFDDASVYRGRRSAARSACVA